MKTMVKPLQKFVIQTFVNRYGYYINRLLNFNQSNAAFTAIERLLSDIEKPIIFDVGAHHGHISQQLRRLFPTSTVYADRKSVV